MIPAHRIICLCLKQDIIQVFAYAGQLLELVFLLVQLRQPALHRSFHVSSLASPLVA